MKFIYFCMLSALMVSTSGGLTHVWAADPMSNRDTIEKIEKEIAKDKEKVSSKKADITTAQTKLDKDMIQYGKDSSQVRDDHENLMNLRNDLVDAKADLYKETNKRKVAQGQAIETDSSC